MFDSGTMTCPEQESAECTIDYITNHKYPVTSLALVLEC